jgi:hypothetical protein
MGPAPLPRDPLPTRDGRMQRAVLAALAEPSSIEALAAKLHWSPKRAKSWVHHLVRAGVVARVGWTRTTLGKPGHLAGQYQRVTR